MCGEEQHPVKAANSTSGGACVPDAEEPPAGFVRYPAGRAPEHVGDEWDTYWDSRVLDESGREVPAWLGAGVSVGR